MANIYQTAVIELQQNNPDFFIDEQSVRDMFKPYYEECSAEASRLYGRDNREGWDRYMINRVKEVLLREEAVNQPHLPLHLYGGFAQRVAEAVAQAYNVSTDMVLAAMFSAIGAAAGNKFKVVHGYTNYPFLWWCLIAPSGYGKTEPVKQILRPLKAYNKTLIMQTKAALSTWRQNGQQGERPRKRQLITSDSTPEARDELLADNPEGLLIYRDELAGLFEDFDRYTRSGEVPRLLTIWSRDDLSVERKSEDTRYIENPLMGIIGGIQPRRFAKVFNTRGMMDNGFFQRWCFVFPDVCIPGSSQQDEIPLNIIKEWAEYIDTLLCEGVQPRTFTLNAEATQLHSDFYQRVADKMADPNVNEVQKEVLSKLRVIVFRLAVIIHLLKTPKDSLPTPPDLIDGETMQAAILSVDALRAWSFKALKLIQGESAGRPMTQAELIRAVRKQWPDMNVSQFCDSVGLSRNTFNYYFRE